MGAFSLVLGILQYAGLYVQLNAAVNVGEADNHISGHGELVWFCVLSVGCLQVQAPEIVIYTLK